MPSPQVALQATSHNISSKRLRMVSMRLPPQFRKEPALDFSTPELSYIKIVIHPLTTSWMRSCKMLQEMTRKTIFHQQSRRVRKQPTHQEKFRGKLRGDARISRIVLWECRTTRFGDPSNSTRLEKYFGRDHNH